MKLTHIDEAYWAERRAEAEREFPGSSFGMRPDLTAEVVDRFEDALHAGSEEAIQVCLTENPYLVQYAIRESGHHGTWVYPKQMIRPKAATGEPGLIPDFLAVTRSSLGDHWWIVELKRFDTQFADTQGGAMSPSGHKGGQPSGWLPLPLPGVYRRHQEPRTHPTDHSARRRSDPDRRLPDRKRSPAHGSLQFRSDFIQHRCGELPSHRSQCTDGRRLHPQLAAFQPRAVLTVPDCQGMRDHAAKLNVGPWLASLRIGANRRSTAWCDDDPCSQPGLHAFEVSLDTSRVTDPAFGIVDETH